MALAEAERALSGFFNPELERSFTAGWPLVSLAEALAVAALYLGCTLAGSALMSGRDALDGPLLRLAMIAYNVVQVGLCGYMTAETAWQYVLLEYRPICNNELVLLPGQPFLPTGMSNVLWVFYLSKVLDFCDTAFIVLRKKDRQLSFLHVFHHTSIFLVYYLQTLIAYNGDGFLAVILNSFVHLVMYSYYGLIAAFPGYSPPWKCWVTRLQMIQFCCMIGQGCYMLAVCPNPGKRVTVLYISYIVFLLGLFNAFSRKTYSAGEGGGGAAPWRMSSSHRGKKAD